MMEDFSPRLSQLAKKLKVEEKRQRLGELEKQMAQPGFWSNQGQAAKIAKEFADIQEEIQEFDHLKDLYQQGDYSQLNREIGSLELKTFFSGPYDSYSAILSLHAGQGGVEAMDWTEMLLRMYHKYAESRGFRFTILEQSFGEEAGIKSATVEVGGNYAYGNLKGEAGVHRLVRQSPFNADNLRQTSFALVEVIPLMEEVELTIKPEDIKIETFRSSGPGGQHMQKTESAVRITHLPTGITASCQSDRFQQRNKEKAMQILRARLVVVAQQKQREGERKLKGGYKVPGWGNQIRSYVLHPYKLVKDLRTGVESAQPEKILDGDLKEFIDAELRQGVGVV